MRSFYGFLVRAGLREDDPTVRIDRPKQRKGLPKPIENREQVLAGLHAHGQRVALLLLETGLRISEATYCGLDSTRMLRDVDVGPAAFTYTECAACGDP